MLALKGLWVFTVLASVFICTALIVCLVVTLKLSNQAKPLDVTTQSLIVRDRLPFDCFRLTIGDQAEQRRAVRYEQRNEKEVVSNEDYMNMTSNCTQFIETRGYFTSPTSTDEENLPLAFAMLVSKDVELFERILRTVYRPNNVYCVFVDSKAEADFLSAVNSIVGCFENVFALQSNAVKINRGLHLFLEQHIMCMEALLKYKNWMYFVSLTGQEFPLRTNWELVQILKKLNGTTIFGTTLDVAPPDPSVGNPTPWIDVSALKALVHLVARRHFVQFAVDDDNARQALGWTEPVQLPSRYYVPPQNNTVSKGGTKTVQRQFINQYKVWSTDSLPCRGNVSEGVCTYGIRDLPMLALSPFFFANKFDLEFEPLGLDCLEELVYNRTQLQMNGMFDFNTCYYECLLH